MLTRRWFTQGLLVFISTLFGGGYLRLDKAGAHRSTFATRRDCSFLLGIGEQLCRDYHKGELSLPDHRAVKCPLCGDDVTISVAEAVRRFDNRSAS
jgi:hypothetical protein